MKMLLIILAVMTWTVKDKNTVIGGGMWPYGCEVSYNCTYQKGQVRAGDEAVLTLSHLEGIQVDKVTLYIKSNGGAGSGKIHVIANGVTVASKSGTYKSWTGAYDGANYRAVTALDKSVLNVEELSIRLIGTVNSLYIERYDIEYQPLPPHTVTLQNGINLYGSLTELESGGGVVLPALSDTSDWHFEGWSETHFWTLYERPELFAPNKPFYPSRNLILWAVYRYQPNREKEYVTDLVSGEYMYVHSTADYALTGFPHDGIMDFSITNEQDEDQYYWIDFVSSETAYITHLATGAPIGYNGTSMAIKESPWYVAHEGDSTTFYTIVNNKKYVLWLSIQDTYMEGEYYAGLLRADPVNSPLKLLIPKVPEIIYTCHPENGVGINNVHENPSNNETVIRFGIYELHIKDGKKEIRL